MDLPPPHNILRVKPGTSSEVSESKLLDQMNMFTSGNSKIMSKLHIIRLGILFLLGSLISGIGVVSFILIQSSETNNFYYIFESSMNQISVATNRKLHAHLLAGEITRNLYSYTINTGSIGTAPNITLPGYEAIMNPLSELASSRTIAFFPVVSSSNRGGWESYAKQHVIDLNGPSHLKTSTGGSWTVANGIYAKDSTGKNVRSPGYSASSAYPDILIPLWQITNISANYVGIMYDTHSDKNRIIALDEAMATKSSKHTDFVQLVFDTNLRPSTVLFNPIISIKDSNVIGFTAVTLTWDIIFQDVLPSFVSGFYFVLSTSTQTYTYLLNNGNIQLVGSGDLHDPTYNRYGRSIPLTDLTSLSSSLKYTLMIYPTKDLYNKYNTNTPTIVSCVLVFGIVFGLLIYFIINRQKRILEGVIETKRILALSTMVPL